MAHPAQQKFCEKVKELFPQYFKNVSALDVGSLDINGNNRYLFEDSTYLGLDLDEGPNVDIVSLAHEFDHKEGFDTIISTEALEHDKYWKLSLENLCRLLKPGGLLVFTCATTGRAEHGTEDHNSWASPFSHIQFDNYYQNLTPKDILSALNTTYFEFFYIQVDDAICDLYFYGKKKT